MEPSKNLDTNKNNLPGKWKLIEIRFRLPIFVGEWYASKAKEQFKHRNNYIKDFLVSVWRKNNGR